MNAQPIAIVAIGAACLAVTGGTLIASADLGQQPAPTVTVEIATAMPAPLPTVTTTTVPAVTTTTAAPLPPTKSFCPQHYAAALRAGWTDAEWPMLDRIMHRESRCDPTAHNDSYLRGGRDNSFGLMQINLLYHDDWVLPQIGNDSARLFDAQTDLWIARQLWEWLEAHNQCGWSAWGGTCG
jgi:hypothetical protein